MVVLHHCLRRNQTIFSSNSLQKKKRRFSSDVKLFPKQKTRITKWGQSLKDVGCLPAREEWIKKTKTNCILLTEASSVCGVWLRDQHTGKICFFCINFHHFFHNQKENTKSLHCFFFFDSALMQDEKELLQIRSGQNSSAQFYKKTASRS